MQSILKNEKEKYDNSKFYRANLEWLADENNKEAWDTMWLEALGACTSTIKKFCRKVPGIYSIEDIEEFAVEGQKGPEEQLVVVVLFFLLLVGH